MDFACGSNKLHGKKTKTIHVSFFIAANKPIAVFNNVYIICSVLVLFRQSKAALRCTMCCVVFEPICLCYR